MLHTNLIAQDILQMCKLIDQGKPDSNENSDDNFAINEVLAYVLHSFLPILVKTENYQILQEQGVLHESLLNLIDIINLKCKFLYFP